MERSGVCLITWVRQGKIPLLRGARPPFWWYAIRAPPHRQRSTTHIRSMLDENNFWDVAVEFVKGDSVRWGSWLIGKELDRRPEAMKFIDPGMYPILAHCHLSYFDDGRPLSAGATSCSLVFTESHVVLGGVISADGFKPFPSFFYTHRRSSCRY